MSLGQYSARIDTLSNVTLGAGFLIDSTRLLTCAHLVQGQTEVRVSFPGELRDLIATVEPLTGWKQQNDVGDMAVLLLKAPITVMPARFAQPTGPYWAGELRAHGFRRGVEPSGSYVTLRTAADMELGKEWWQLQVDGPESLANGFSGAAVYAVDTGEVIGMVTDADLEHGGRMGRMLPLSTLRRHWEDLDDLLPLAWLSSDDRSALHEIVRGTAAGDGFRQVYTEAFPGSPPRYEFRSAWDAIRYVAEELYEEGRLGYFLDRLGCHLPNDIAHRLTAWSRRTLRATPSGPGRSEWDGQAPPSIVIRLERRTRGESYDLTLSTLVHGMVGRATPPVQVREAEVRKEVEKRLPALLGDVIGSDWMIEFALPESWLGRPVEEWRAGDTLMLVHPVVVRDVERLKPAFRQDRAILRWTFLRKRASTLPELVGCSDMCNKDRFFYWLTAHDDVCVLVHAQRPRPSQLTAALNAGIPVMVWPRLTCSDPVHSDCAGERMGKELTALVAATHPDSVPRLVRKLRAEARSQPRDQPHCGRRLTLLWDDPARLPDPPLAMPI